MRTTWAVVRWATNPIPQRESWTHHGRSSLKDSRDVLAQSLGDYRQRRATAVDRFRTRHLDEDSSCELCGARKQGRCGRGRELAGELGASLGVHPRPVLARWCVRFTRRWWERQRACRVRRDILANAVLPDGRHAIPSQGALFSVRRRRRRTTSSPSYRAVIAQDIAIPRWNSNPDVRHSRRRARAHGREDLKAVVGKIIGGAGRPVKWAMHDRYAGREANRCAHGGPRFSKPLYPNRVFKPCRKLMTPRSECVISVFPYHFRSIP